MISRLTLKELANYLERIQEMDPGLERALEKDRRRGARVLLERYRLREAARRAERQRLHNMMNPERVYWRKKLLKVAGVDEAGRGPLAGPVVAVAVILPPETAIEGLDDSKKLSAGTREKLYFEIEKRAVGIGIGIGSVEDIDRLNIYGALMQAMRDALAALPERPDQVLVDGFPIRGLDMPQQAIKGGDAASLCIAAASVVAKVTRDRMMDEAHRRYPEYGFDRNRGYGTAEHISALRKYGPCPLHRRSFNLGCAGRAGEPV